MTKKAKPIIFSPPMVQAIIEGRKTMTRRAPCKNPYMPGDILWVRETWQEVYETEYDIYNPNEPLRIADLIVGFDNLPKKCAGLSREWSCSSMPARNKYYVYAASKPEYTDENHELKWRPPIHMPREAARLFLRVTASRPERLTDISIEDAIAEGCTGIRCEHPNIRIGICTDCYNHGWLESPTAEFFGLWESLNGKRYDGRYSIKNDPWVWAYTFERISKEEAEA